MLKSVLGNSEKLKKNLFFFLIPADFHLDLQRSQNLSYEATKVHP